MSALAGIVGGADHHLMMRSMMTALGHRVREGWLTGNNETAAIGIGFTRRLPEDPLHATIFGDDNLRLVCDARLDNRDQLARELDVGDIALSDGDLIFLAYRKWGRDFCKHLLGDFAIAILDLSNNHLLLARDHFGVKPLFYRESAGEFAFASEVKALADLEGSFGKITLADIEESKILAFVGAFPPSDHTIMTPSLKRVPPGHTLEVSPSSTPQLLCYWEPRPGPPIDNGNAAVEFRRIFDVAVRARLRCIEPVACLLSGGLDSTSIACSAAHALGTLPANPLKTVSAVFDSTPDQNERPFIEAALQRHRFDAHFVPFDEYAPFHDFASIARPHWRLINAPGMRMTTTLMTSARKIGAGVLLHGHGGDEVVSHGFGRLYDMAKARRWRELWNEVGGVCRLYGESRPRFMMAAVLRYSRFPLFKLIRRFYKKRRAAPVASPGLLKSDAVLAHMFIQPPRALGEVDRHIDDLKSMRHVEAIEMIELNAAREGLEARFPFYDVRLVELCLSLPPEAKLAKGWTRFVLRRAMEGIIPDKVQWRTSKFDFTIHIARGLYLHHKAEIQSIISNDPQALGRYVDIDYLSTQFQALCRNPTGEKVDIQSIWRALCLNDWLKTSFVNSDGGQ